MIVSLFIALPVYAGENIVPISNDDNNGAPVFDNFMPDQKYAQEIAEKEALAENYITQKSY